MKPLVLALLLALCLVISGCEGVFFGFTTGVNSHLVVATGTVSIVRLTITDGNTTVTIVTLVDNGFGNDFTFCGDMRPQFPLGTPVKVTYAPGTPCNSNVVVVVM